MDKGFTKSKSQKTPPLIAKNPPSHRKKPPLFGLKIAKIPPSFLSLFELKMVDYFGGYSRPHFVL